MSVILIALAVTSLTAGASAQATSTDSSGLSSILPQSMSGYPSTQSVLQNVQAGETLRSFPSDFRSQIQKLISSQNNGDGYPGSGTPKCIGSTGAAVERLSDCTGGDLQSSNVMVLIGDSRTGMWGGTFHNLGFLTKWKVITLYKSGCPTGLADFVPTGNLSGVTWADCSKFHINLLAEMNRLKPKVIVISSQTQMVVTTPAPVHLASPTETTTALASFIRRLPSASKVVVLGGFPTPGYNHLANPTTCLSRSPRNPSFCNFTEQSNVLASNQAFKSSTKQTGAGYIDSGPWFCGQTCPAIISGDIVYTTDAYHADGRYLNVLTRALYDQLKPYMVH